MAIKTKYKYTKTDWAIALLGFVFLFFAIAIIAFGLENGSMDDVNLWYCLAVSSSLSIVREYCKWSTLTGWIND